MISVMMLTHNRIGSVMRCLQTVAPAVKKVGAEWIILDNGSADGTANWLRRVVDKQPGLGIKLILKDDNLGVAGGRQAMLGIAQGDLLVFLDSDVTARDDMALARLTFPMSDKPQIGLCGPGGNWLTAKWQWYTPAPESYVGEIDIVSGYCQAFRREVVEQGAALDQAYNPYWHEDTDFCMQIKQLGYTIWATGDVGFRHEYAGSGDDGSGMKKQAYLASKWAGKGLIRWERENGNRIPVHDPH